MAERSTASARASRTRASSNRGAKTSASTRTGDDDHNRRPAGWRRRSLAPDFVGPHFHYVGFAQVEIAGLIAQRAPQKDFDASKVWPAAAGIFVAFVYGEPSRFPARD